MCALNLKKRLEENNLIDKALSQYPEYDLVLTGKFFISIYLNLH